MELVLGNDMLPSGMSLYSSESLTNASLPLYYPGQTVGLFVSMCMENSFNLAGATEGEDRCL
jgi:hypothetical protein